MAKCPKCKIDWLWDSELDHYRYKNGDLVKLLKENAPWKDHLGHEITMFQCKCGEINSIVVSCEANGIDFAECSEWITEDIDWFEDEHSYPEALHIKS